MTELTFAQTYLRMLIAESLPVIIRSNDPRWRLPASMSKVGLALQRALLLQLELVQLLSMS